MEKQEQAFRKEFAKFYVFFYVFGVLIVIAVLPSGEDAKRTLGYGTLSRQKGAQPHI